MTMRPPQLPRDGSVLGSAAVVNVIGAAAVPAALILPPGRIMTAGASPVPSQSAMTVTPGLMVSVAPACTNTWHVRVRLLSQTVSDVMLPHAASATSFLASDSQDQLSFHSVLSKAPLYDVESKKPSLGTESVLE